MQFKIVQIGNLMNSKIVQMKTVNVCLFSYDEPQNSTDRNLYELHNGSNRKIGIKVDPKETKIEHLMQFKIVQIGNLMDSKIVQLKKVNVCMSSCLYKYDAPQ